MTIQKVREINVVKKEWGTEYWMVNNDLYCMKILEFNPNHKISIHQHYLKDETFLYVQGKLIVELVDPDSGKASHFVFEKVYESIRIRPKTLHSVIALTYGALIEISTHHEDSDSVRLPHHASHALSETEVLLYHNIYYGENIEFYHF